MIVIDTSAIIAILVGEPDAAEIAKCLGSGEELALSTGTALEMAIVAQAKWGSPGAARLDHFVEELSPTLVAVDMDQLRLARDGYRRFGRGSGHPAKLNYGDCFAYALARQHDAPLLFKGDDFAHTDIRPALPSVP